MRLAAMRATQFVAFNFGLGPQVFPNRLPAGVSFAVEGHLINIRLIIGPRAFGAIVVSRKFIDRIS